MTKVKDTIDICGCLVHAVKGQEKNVENALTAISGVEVHHVTDNSRLVVTIERENQGKIADTMGEFNDIDGVVSTVLTYQHSEPI
jgi:nitrate reductase NapD